MSAGARRALGSFAILLIALAWIVAVASLSAWVTAWPWFAQLVFYLVAGTAWILPLRPLFRWMNRSS